MNAIFRQIAAVFFIFASLPLLAAERRMVFHELPTPPQSAYVAYSTWPRISGNGQKIVSAYPDAGTGLYRFRAINFDGTGAQEIDAQRGVGEDNGYFLSALSADGGTYARANRGVITLCSTTGGVGTEYLRLNGGVGGLALSDDGTKLFVLVSDNATFFGTGTVIEAGLWEFPTAGPLSARRVILSKTSVAAALGIPIGDIAKFTPESDVAVSQGAQRLVCSFVMPFIGYWPTRVIGVNLDGSNIHQFGGTYDQVNALAISADGGKVAILHGYSTPQAVVANFDGSNPLVVASGPVAANPPASLTANGSHLCLRGGWLYRTDGVSREYLFHTFNTIPQSNMREGEVCMMSRDGRRFSYVEGGINRLNCIEIDPASLGAAPDITQPSATPPFVVYNNGTSTTLRVRATFPGTPNGVASKVFEDGAVDTALYSSNFGGDVNDTGTNGDVTAGDGYYTVSGFECYYADAGAPGPKMLRFAAQSRDAGNLRHSTIIDYVPFSVLTSAPLGSAPAITSLNPDIAVARSRVTINGANFNPSRAFNVVTMNRHNVEIVSANAGGTQLVFDIPAWFADGAYDVVVTANGQSSAPAVFTIASLTPDIAVEQPAGSSVPDEGARDFGVIDLGASTSRVFTIKNPGSANLTGLAITIDGANAASFTVTNNPTAPVSGPNGSTPFTVQFSSATSGMKTAVLHIASNVAGKNPYDIKLTGQAYSFTADTDGDGLNDGSEVQLAPLGFDRQVSQPALVAMLFGNLNGALPNLNAAGIYNIAQVQELCIGKPLLTRNPATGQFKLTIGIQKSLDLINYSPFPMTQGQTSINAAGELEFLFTSPENAAFFRVQVK